jgi:hypothetical protein
MDPMDTKDAAAEVGGLEREARNLNNVTDQQAVALPAATPDAVPGGSPDLPDSPFRDDALLFFPGAAIRNEVSEAQADPMAARVLSARHVNRLLYSSDIPWRGNRPYPQIEDPSGTSHGT